MSVSTKREGNLSGLVKSFLIKDCGTVFMTSVFSPWSVACFAECYYLVAGKTVFELVSLRYVV